MNALTEARFRDLLVELVDENPFAVRPVLKILGVEFTGAVPTLAVTCEDRPRLLVNLDFLKAHCRTDDQVKAVICHEFLHVVLRHTETKGPLSAERHLAFDAVINAIIHRQFGPAYSSMMAEYYKGAGGLKRILRPMDRSELNALRNYRPGWTTPPQWVTAWDALYEGKLVVDDIEDLARDLAEEEKKAGRGGGGAVAAGIGGEMANCRSMAA